MPFPMKPQGLEAPSPIGGPPPPKMSQAAANPGEPDSDDMGGPPAVRPEAVHYHDGPQNCGSCEYMGQDGNCAILQMQVNPEGGCSAWESKNEGGEGGEDMMAEEPPDTQDQGSLYGR